MMHGLIVCDQAVLGQDLHELLSRLAVEVPRSSILSLEGAVRAVEHERPTFDLVFVALSRIEDAGLAAIRRLALLPGSKIVVVGPADDPKQILAAIHAGASDYLDTSGNLSDELRRIIQLVTQGRTAARAPGRVITVTSASGGAGASVLASNLAAALASNGGNCGLLDFDLRGGDLAALLNLKPQHSVVDLCRNAAKLDAAMFEQSLTQHASGVHLLAAPPLIDDMHEVTVESINRIIELAVRRFSYSVVDLEDHFHKEQVRLLHLSDRIFLLLRLDFICLQNVLRCLDHMRRMGIDTTRVELVANRCGQAKELSFQQAEEALGCKVGLRIPDDAKTINTTVNTGVPAVLEWPSSRVAKAIVGWADAVRRQLPT
jgi:pilus assembly protein CpaE